MSISVTVSGEDSTSVVLAQALSDTVSVSGISAVQVTTTSGDAATVTVSTGDPITITGNYSNYVTGDVVRPNEISNFLTSSQISSNIDSAINSLVDSAPDALNTLNELAAALNDDENFGSDTIVSISNLNSATGELSTATGLLVQKSETGIFYTNDNPSGFITGVDLSDLQTATGNLDARVSANDSDIDTVSGLITSNDGEISALQTATGLLVQKSETGNFVTDSDTGAFYAASNPSGFITGVDLSNYVETSETGNFITDSDTGAFYASSNPSGFITGVDLSSYVQDSETGLFLVSGQDAVVNALEIDNGGLQIGSTPTYSFSRSIKLLDNGVQFGARVSLVGTDDDGYPGLEMVTDGNLSKRTLIRHEGEGNNDYGLSFFTTNNSVVSESVRFNGDGSVGIGTSSPSEKLDVRGDALISGVLNIRDISQNSNKSITAANNNLTFSNVHGIFGYSIGLRGNRGSTLGMESAGSILDISAPSDITLTPGGVTDIQSDLNVYGNTITTGDLTVSGNSFFQNRPTVNGTGVLLSGEGGGGAVENVVYTTGDQEVSGIKNFSETLKAGKITLSENSFVTETGNFTISSTHRGATVLLQNSNPITVTVPAQVSGHVTTFIAETSSAVLFATGAGISGLNSFGGANQIAGIFGQAQIIFKSNEYAFLGGNLA